MEQLSTLLASFELDARAILPYMVGFGVLLALVGLNATVFARPSAAQRRLEAGLRNQNSGRVVRLEDNDPKGILRLFVPHTERERSQIALKLRRAGIHRVNAVRTYYLVRLALAIAFPAIVIGFYLSQQVLPPSIAAFIAPLVAQPISTLFAISAILMAVGFYLPALWLKAKIDDRKKAITRGMPNALDLMQVSTEAGLGFDAAMTRVAREMSKPCPPIAEEFTIVQLEVQAGKDRDRALTDLSARTDVDEMAAFANVITQSAEFGTPISEALVNVANELRLTRELKAQEQANKLPVKMSGVLAGIMMPVLLMITLTPIAIRWVRMWAEAG